MTSQADHLVPGPRDDAAAREANGRMTPELARRIEFGRSPLGRRGYLESDVERFRMRMVDEMARAAAEKAELRAEIERLRNYFRERGVDPRQSASGRNGTGAAAGAGVAAVGNGLGSAVDIQAVNLISQAQQAADQHIAQAEDYSRRLVGDARAQYEQILREARELAEQAARDAAVAYQEATRLEDRVGEREKLEAKLAYLKTFTQVTQVQMRSILQALSSELETLGALATGEIPLAPSPFGGSGAPPPSGGGALGARGGPAATGGVPEAGLPGTPPQGTLPGTPANGTFPGPLGHVHPFDGETFPGNGPPGRP